MLGAHHPLIVSTRKKFELARSKLLKHSAKQKRGESFLKSKRIIYSPEYRSGFIHRIPSGDEEEVLEFQQENSLSFAEIAPFNKPQVCKPKGIKPKSNLDTKADVKNEVFPTERKGYAIQTTTSFKKCQHQIDKLQIYGVSDAGVSYASYEKAHLHRNSLFRVKILEDDDYGYDSDESLEGKVDVPDDFSDWLQNPEINIGALNAVASSLSQVCS